MEPAVAAIALVLSGFISTSTDNLVLLAVVLGSRDQHRLPVLIGYAASALLIAVAGLLAARLADSVPVAMIGFLGLIPLALGAWKLVRAFVVRGDFARGDFARGDVARGDLEPVRPTAASTLGAGSVLLLMLANGSDTFAVLLPLFAETPEPLTYLMAAAVVTAACAWFGVALAIGSSAVVRATLMRVERWLVPVMLMAIGLYIVADTITDTL